MKHLLALLVMFAVGCVAQSGGGNPPPPPPDRPDAPQPPPPGGDTCVGGDKCVCPLSGPCTEHCTAGAAQCHVQGGPDSVDAVCNHNGECHVECRGSTSCEVDCGGSADCQVTCPATGCTVTNCAFGTTCNVTCGVAALPTISGTTATCP